MSRHPFDLFAPIWYRIDPRSRIFTGGWGDEGLFDLLAFPLTAADPLPRVDPIWGRKEEQAGFRVRRGSFTSPAAEFLPEVTRPVTVEWVEPAFGADRTVVLMPAWNDETPATRRSIAVELASRGVGSLIADIPFYGPRRLHPDREPPIQSVAEFALMGHGAVAEARALVGLAADVVDQVGVAGFSMGGSLAAATSSTVAQPVATTSIAGAHGPGPVFTEGPLRMGIDWDALGGRTTALPRLAEIFGRASVRTMPQLSHHPAAVVMAGSRDGIVAPSWSRDLASHWDAEYRVVEGAGHATLLWRHRPVIADAIARSFDRLAGHD